MLKGAAMIDLSGLNLVVGLGKTGLSLVRALARLGAETIAVADSRREPPGLEQCVQEFPAVARHLGEFSPALFTQAARLWLSPGVSPQTPAIAAARACGIAIGGDIELFARLAEAPIAAITGTNGKSTVTTLLGQMAGQAGRRVAVGGNLGEPALDLLIKPPPEWYVLELSSFQLETTHSLNAQVATILNISPDHLDRHGDMENYIAAKRRIFRGDGIQVLNADDPSVAAMAEPGRIKVRFTLGEPAPGEFGVRQYQGEPWLACGTELWLAVRELRTPGAHNQANALAALALGQALQLPRAAMLAAVRDFDGLPHRVQWVADSAGVRWLNDSKGTNVGATVAAVAGLPGRVVLIAGGDGKGQDFAPLAPVLAAKVRALVLFGRDAPAIATAVASAAPIHRATDLAQAVDLAAALAQPGDSVLLSPACASFDMFSDYRARGVAFADAVRRRAS